MKIKTIEILRVVAQFMVVGSHTLYLFDWSNHQFFADILWPIMRNSTVFFLIMSGYLFAYNQSDFKLWSFYKKRFFRVVIPYFFCLIPVSLLYAFDNTLREDLTSWLNLFLTGFNPHNPALWFFPLMVCFYILAPFSNWLYKRPPLFLHLWVLLTFISSLYFHRPFKVSQLDHSLLYFLFPYFFGLWLFRYESYLLNKLQSWQVQVSGLVTLGVIYYFQIKEGVDFNFHRGYISYLSIHDATWLQPDLSILQKLLVFVLFFNLLNKRQLITTASSKLISLSTYCFGIHLYHGYFISMVRVSMLPYRIPESPITFWFVWIAFFVFSVIFVWGIQKILKDKAHWMLG